MIVEIQAIIPLKKTTALSMEFRLLGTGSLAPANFSGAVFTCAHFQKLAQISSLCDFHYISEGIPSLVRFWLLMT